MENHLGEPAASAQELAWLRSLVDEGAILYRQEEHDQLIDKFVAILKQRFHASMVGVYKLIEGNEQLALTEDVADSFFQNHDLISFTPQMRDLLASHLAVMDLKQLDHWQGVNRSSIQGDSCYFVLLGQSGQDAMMVAWLDRPPLNYRATFSPATEDLALGFLVTGLQRAYQWSKQLAGAKALIYKDDLTGLYNYRFLEIALDTEIRRAQRFQTNFCLLFIDLDNFKPINDNYGHLSGSMVIKQAAGILTEGVREIDSVFRYGGDEYVVLLLGASSAAGLLTGERIRARFEQYGFITEGGEKVHLTASIGVASYPEHGTQKEQLLKIADQCMYRSKRGGKNRVVAVEQTAPALGTVPDRLVVGEG